MASQRLIHADLRTYSSEILLHKRIFENPDFLDWIDDESELVLQLDSLDEGLLRIDTIANLLAEELPRYPITRLSLRIACRRAVWPSSTLEPALETIWGASGVGIFEMTPLCRRDVADAATIIGLDADSFFRELYTANVVPFAIRPLTLNLLLDLFKKDGKLPRSVADIYLRGCLTLCEEQNPSRRDTGRLGAHTAAQQLRIASRIAAVTMLANRYAVWVGPEGEGVPEEDISLRTIAGSTEQGNFPPFTITEAAIRETVDTGLFTSRGTRRMGWAHQSYAEFLAASYLVVRGVSPANILKLILHPSGGVIPQLAIVAAWVASFSKAARNELMRVEPLILLQGDLSGWTNADLEDLTKSILAALERKTISDFSLASILYRKLKHPAIAGQLRFYIRDPSKTIISRRAALLIAEQCGLLELKHDLLKVALDRTEHRHLRAKAISALSSCGGETAADQLIPFAKGELGDDPHDEMRGYALEILWPKHLNTNELFSLISRPCEGFVGSYVNFLTRTIPETLTNDELPIALRWATSLGFEGNKTSDFHLRSLADSIVIRAWANSDALEIGELLLAYILKRLGAHQELFGGTGLRRQGRFYEDLGADASVRRQLLIRAMHRPLDDIAAYHFSRSRLVQKEDLKWLLDLSPSGADYDPKLNPNFLCELIRQIANLDDENELNFVYAAALKWDALWQTYRAVFEGIPLDSEDPKLLRKNHEMMLRRKATVGRQ